MIYRDHSIIIRPNLTIIEKNMLNFSNFLTFTIKIFIIKINFQIKINFLNKMNYLFFTSEQIRSSYFLQNILIDNY